MYTNCKGRLCHVNLSQKYDSWFLTNKGGGGGIYIKGYIFLSIFILEMCLSPATIPYPAVSVIRDRRMFMVAALDHFFPYCTYSSRLTADTALHFSAYSDAKQATDSLGKKTPNPTVVLSLPLAPAIR